MDGSNDLAKVQSLAWVFVMAVLFNYAWELAQAPLFVGLERYSVEVIWHCFVASLGDGIMVLIIFAGGGIIMRRWDWFQRPRLIGYVIMVTGGLMLAVSVEWVALHILGRWAYTEAMPTIPGLRVGLVPLAQMVLLPPLIFRAVAYFESRKP